MSDKQIKDYDKFNVRFPDGMRDAIAERAKANGRSMNSEIVQILQDAIVRDEFECLDHLKEITPNAPISEVGEVISITKQNLEHAIQSAAEGAAQEAINIILKHYDVEAKKKPT